MLAISGSSRPERKSQPIVKGLKSSKNKIIIGITQRGNFFFLLVWPGWTIPAGSVSFGGGRIGEKTVLTVAVGITDWAEVKGFEIIRRFLRAQPVKFFREAIFRVTEELDNPFLLKKVWYWLMV